VFCFVIGLAHGVELAGCRKLDDNVFVSSDRAEGSVVYLASSESTARQVVVMGWAQEEDTFTMITYSVIEYSNQAERVTL
jgi:hypothetical protein